MWIDPKVALPPDGELVLVKAKLHGGKAAPFIAKRDRGIWILQGWLYERAPVVLAWMRIPEGDHA